MSKRVAPPRRTEAERRATHEAIYGAGAPLPPRQYRFVPHSGALQLPTEATPLLILLGGLALIWFLSRR